MNTRGRVGVFLAPPRSSVAHTSVGQGQKAHRLPTDNYACLSLILAVFAKVSLEILLQ